MTQKNIKVLPDPITPFLKTPAHGLAGAGVPSGDAIECEV
jgi:hypothetical protein